MKNQVLTVDQIVVGVVSFLQKNGSEHLAAEVASELARRYQHQLKAVITTPIALTQTQQLSAIKMVTKLSGVEGLDYTFVQDDQLIDGMKVAINDHLYDLSLDGQLKSVLENI